MTRKPAKESKPQAKGRCVQRLHQGDGAKQQGGNGEHEDELGEAPGGGAINELQARKDISPGQ